MQGEGVKRIDPVLEAPGGAGFGSPALADAALGAVLDQVRKRQGTPDPRWFLPALEWNRSRGADETLLARAASFGRDGGVVIVTGQQVGLFGGPLYTLYKLLSAVELASALEERTGIQVLPVFWVVGDDSDFGEVSATWFPDLHGRPQRIRDAEEPPGGTLTGPLPVARHREILGELALLLEGREHGAAVRARIERALSHAHTWAELHAALFHAALGPRSAFFVDGGAEALLGAAGSWLESAAAAPLAQLLREGAAGLEDPPLAPELGERSLFHLARGRREPIVDPGPAALETLLSQGGHLAPNVVLRPVLQDHLLPNVATVCGPSEIRYRKQLGPIYAHLGVPEPLRPARFSAVLVPSLGCAGSDETAAYERASRDPAGFLDERVEALLPAELTEPLVSLRARIRIELASLEPGLSAFDKSLPQLVSSAAAKADYQFDRMIEGVRGKTRQRLQKRCPALASLIDFVRPRERPQERSLSWWTPLAIDGMETIDTLAVAARAHALTAISRASSRGGSDEILDERAVFRLEGIGECGEDPTATDAGRGVVRTKDGQRGGENE